MHELASYWWNVTTHAVKNWWEWASGNIFQSLPLSLVVFALTWVVVRVATARWPSLQERLEGILSSWAAIVVGAIVVAIVLLGVFIGFFLSAPYQLHKHEQTTAKQATGEHQRTVADRDKTIDELRNEIIVKNKQIEDRMPRLTAEISQLSAAMATGSIFSTSTPMVSLYCVVRNTGQPSIAENWKVTLGFPDGRTMDGRIVMFDTVDWSATDEGGKEVPRQIKEEDMLIRKTEDPVAKGDAIHGWIFATFDGISLEELRSPETAYSITFRDVYGTRSPENWQKPTGSHFKIPSGGSFYLQGEGRN